MIPGTGRGRTTSYYSPYVAPDDKMKQLLTDWELGSTGIGDTTDGLMYQNWSFSYAENGDIIATPQIGNPSILLNVPGISEIACTFDANMAPAIAYMKSGRFYFYWFNSLVSNYVTSEFDGVSPKLTLDDKRVLHSDECDVILFYLRSGKTYYRQQRDRYATEYYFCDCPHNTTRLGRVGMNKQMCVQLEFLS